MTDSRWAECVKKLLYKSNTLLQEDAGLIAEALTAAHRAGVCDGLEMAAKIAAGYDGMQRGREEDFKPRCASDEIAKQIRAKAKELKK